MEHEESCLVTCMWGCARDLCGPREARHDFHGCDGSSDGDSQDDAVGIRRRRGVVSGSPLNERSGPPPCGAGRLGVHKPLELLNHFPGRLRAKSRRKSVMVASTLQKRSHLPTTILFSTLPRDDPVSGQGPVVEGIFRLGLRVDDLRAGPMCQVGLLRPWTVFTTTPEALCHNRGRVRPCWKLWMRSTTQTDDPG